MRVIAGLAKGRKLNAPSGYLTRPITDMIKGALFNVLGAKVEGAFFLDLFAGSGSVGIEALSRGAEKVYFVDQSQAAAKIIKENIKRCQLEAGASVFMMDAFKALELFKRRQEKFACIYVDPPFTNEKIFSQIMTKLGEYRFLSDEGIIIIRAPKNKELSQSFNNLIQYRYNSYGESSLYYYNSMERS
ncbi:MAG: 16S rRNA (guanine(966)-N(2))-methyltransferase RsmD [Syntrophomonadaceae bacterium]|jgi:16S rRNA (guanine(966)-N(2))-methyltransferase RsmD|nr:16S rRNA (guanine(966)-N(2))-methyltransferase RsmD [Syntrophomonadaceae bacterium]